MPTTALAKSISFRDDLMHVVFTDGRIFSALVMWFPLLRETTPQQREHYEIGGGGVSIHWPEVDKICLLLD